jgi:ElaB/YqjD/DUF883 family membrane-anchored ribosome-binding protein
MNVKNYTEPLKSQISETWQNARGNVTKTARNVSRATDHYIHENPWTTIAVVALAACVAGYLLSRSRDKRRLD